MSGRGCERHREALADLAERGEPSPAGAAAIAHVGRCPECAEVLGELVLTVIALRRLAEVPAMTAAIASSLARDPLAAPGDGAPTDTTWTRLRARIERSRQAAREQAWRWRTSLGAMVASALVVATLVGPATLRFGGGGVDIISGAAAELDAASWQIEADYVAGAHAGTYGDAASVVDAAVSSLRRYPDDLRPARKEVAPARSTGPVPDAR
ncbi:MAG TPA: hypothetical protein VF494_02790 [Candidatus Limnocylindrales bacterium]